LLEDVVVPVEKLADTCVELSGLFDKYANADSVVFGHAKDGQHPLDVVRLLRTRLPVTRPDPDPTAADRGKARAGEPRVLERSGSDSTDR
jgi:FAD/FMN-containing dehydrogenase